MKIQGYEDVPFKNALQVKLMPANSDLKSKIKTTSKQMLLK